MGVRPQKNRRSSSSLPLFLIFLLAIIFLENSVGAFEYPNDKQPSMSRLKRIQKYLAKINKPAVLSIQSPDGDIIDCVDKWKQPAFDHPLLKNHTLQLAPSKLPFEKENEKRGEKVEFSKRAPVQVWHLNGTSCPKDTVPIRRTTVKDMLMAKSLRRFRMKDPNTGPGRRNMTIFPNVNNPRRHEHAVVRADSELVFGATAAINIWNPSIGDAREFSLSQIWVYRSQPQEDFTSMEAGWHVYPENYGAGDQETRIFTYWTSDDYVSTGCYNLECPGFVQTGDFIVLGGTLTPYSIINGQQYDGTFRIYQDSTSGNWWLKYGFDDVWYEVGYFPPGVMPSLKNGATGVEWGGEVTNGADNAGRRGEHTITQMGSGRFAHDGFGLAAYFRELNVYDADGYTHAPQITSQTVTKPFCYSLTSPTWESSIPGMGLHFYYGGNGGGNPDCLN